MQSRRREPSQARAKALIRSRFGAQTGLVIAAVQSGSPYQSETLRSTLASLFGPLVAIALPEPSGTDTDELLVWMIDLQTALQQFMLAARHAHNRVQHHA